MLQVKNSILFLRHLKNFSTNIVTGVSEMESAVEGSIKIDSLKFHVK